jgi:tetratricopeptide (TPR) repeat protein
MNNPSRLLIFFLVFFDTYIISVFGDDEYVLDEYAEQRFRAQALHDKALELAIAGRELDAIYDFEAATELDPTNAGFFSDLGVTQMRVGLLDEALNSFMVADELKPGMQLVKDNLVALQEHLDFREKQKNRNYDGHTDETLAEEL